MAKCGMPRAKFAVPSMGSTTQTSRSKEPPPSSPKKESSGNSRAQPGADQLLHLGIGGGEKILRPLEIRALRARPLQEALAREHAGSPARRRRRRQISGRGHRSSSLGVILLNQQSRTSSLSAGHGTLKAWRMVSGGNPCHPQLFLKRSFLSRLKSLTLQTNPPGILLSSNAPDPPKKNSARLQRFLSASRMERSRCFS